MYRLVNINVLNIWLAVAAKTNATLEEFIGSLNAISALSEDQFFDIVVCEDCKYYDDETRYCKYWKTHNHSKMDFCSNGDDIRGLLS